MLRSKRNWMKKIARERIEYLLEKAIETSKYDFILASKQANLARRICLRYNIRLSFNRKRLFCHGCKGFIVPGVNCRVRLEPKAKMIKITCLDCDHVYRRSFKKP